jgi:hypothetical protein
MRTGVIGLAMTFSRALRSLAPSFLRGLSSGPDRNQTWRFYSYCLITSVPTANLPYFGSTARFLLAMSEVLMTQDEAMSALVAYIFSGAVGSPKG